MAKPRRLRLRCRSDYRGMLYRCTRRRERQSYDLPVRQLRTQLGTRAALHVFGYVHREDLSDQGRNHTAHRWPDVQCVQSSEFCTAEHRPGRRTWLAHSKIRNARKRDFTTYRATWRGTRRRYLATHDRLSGQNRILKAGQRLPLLNSGPSLAPAGEKHSNERRIANALTDDSALRSMLDEHIGDFSPTGHNNAHQSSVLPPRELTQTSPR